MVQQTNIKRLVEVATVLKLLLQNYNLHYLLLNTLEQVNFIFT